MEILSFAAPESQFRSSTATKESTPCMVMGTARSISSAETLKMMASRLATASATDRVLSVNVSNARTRKSVGLVAAVAAPWGLFRRGVPRRQSCPQIAPFGI